MVSPSYAAETIEISNSLPLWLVLVPVTGSFLVYWVGRVNERLRDYLAIGVSGVSFLLAVLLFDLARQGDVVCRLGSFLNFGLNFRLDMLGGTFLLFSSFIWLLATIFSWVYMEHEENRNRYYFFLTLTLGGCLGVYLMEDFFGLLLFFELMSLASYVLVIHAETDEAMNAGRNYLYLGVMGGLSILTGIFLLYINAGTVAIVPLLEKLDFAVSLRYLIAAFFIAGFAIKAGMVPLHIWLPQAHPVAPSPASALLSGLMIKTGAYGIIRIVNMLFTPEGHQTPLWEQTASLGFVVIWFGMATMFIAAFIALFQSNAKRILAYSSISQMGYMLMGIGCAAYLGYEGAIGFAGSTYHIMNHAFFKAGMFMMIGAVYVRTHQLELSRLGGLHRHFPVTSFAFLTCACGLAGIPGFNGYASKTLLHHAIVEAFEHHHVISLFWAEKIYTVTSAFTVCYITRLYTSVFFGAKKPGVEAYGEETFLEKIIFALMALAVLLMGLFPSFMLENIIVPVTRGFSYDPSGVGHLLKLNIWTAHDLEGIAIILGLGFFVFFVFSRAELFTLPLPEWLSVEGLVYRPFVRIAGEFFTLIAGKLPNDLSEAVIISSRKPLARVAGGMDFFDNVLLKNLGGKMMQAVVFFQQFLYRLLMHFISFFFYLGKGGSKRAFNFLIKVDYDYNKEEFYSFFNILNFDFAFILLFLAFVLIALLGLF